MSHSNGPASAARLYELLADGQWHSVPKVITELSKLVPPGVAARRAEEGRAVQQRRRLGEDRGRVKGLATTTTAGQIRTGQWDLARKRLREIIERGTTVEVNRPLGRAVWRDPETQIRLLPQPGPMLNPPALAALLDCAPSTITQWLATQPDEVPGGWQRLTRGKTNRYLIPASTVHAWATWLAAHRTGTRSNSHSDALTWQPLDGETDALWNSTREQWEQVNGRWVTRPANRTNLNGQG
jgi:hypothetical protein